MHERPDQFRLWITLACVYYVMKGSDRPDHPTNEGTYRPVDVIAPEGNDCQNAPFPSAPWASPIRLRSTRICGTSLLGLLSGHPERCALQCTGSMTPCGLAASVPHGPVLFPTLNLWRRVRKPPTPGWHRRRSYPYEQFPERPTEVIEITYPLMVEKYGLVAGQ